MGQEPLVPGKISSVSLKRSNKLLQAMPMLKASYFPTTNFSRGKFFRRQIYRQVQTLFKTTILKLLNKSQ